MRFTLDEWMIRLYPGLKFDHDDYAERAFVVRDLIWELASQALRAGADVVFDWNAWSAARREWAIERAHGVDATVVLHWLSTTPEEAARRLKQRSDVRGTYAHDVTADGNTHLAALMKEPTEDEGLTIVRV